MPIANNCLLVWFMLSVHVALGNQYFAATDGSAGGDGSAGYPWDLQTGLNQPADLQPGDTLWLKGGTYSGHFTSNISGSADAYVSVIQYPGERTTIQDNRQFASGATIQINGAYTIYKDFEITNVFPNRNALDADSFRPMGLQVEGAYIKCINLVIHDTGHGIGLWSAAVDAEIYGCLIFNCGTKNIPGIYSTHGHGIYSQNNAGTKKITNNIIFNNAGFGLHLYPNPGNIIGYSISGNTLFQNGILSNDTIRYANILVQPYPPYTADAISITDNYTYDGRTTFNYNSLYQADVLIGALDADGGNLVLNNNYFVGKARPGIACLNWNQIEAQQNTTYYLQNGTLGLVVPAGVDPDDYTWPDNHYYGGPYAEQFSYQFSLPFNFATWQLTTGFDALGNFSLETPPDHYVVQPNLYAPGRAHIMAWLFTQPLILDINLSDAGLANGQHYRIVDATNFFGPNLYTGIFDDTNPDISIPIDSLSTQAPIGMSPIQHTAPEFLCLIILPDDALTNITELPSSAHTVQITPNPAADIIKVNTKSQLTSYKSFTFINSQGEVVYRTAQPNCTISIAFLPKGLYTLIAETDKEILSSTFVKL